MARGGFVSELLPSLLSLFNLVAPTLKDRRAPPLSVCTHSVDQINPCNGNEITATCFLLTCILAEAIEWVLSMLMVSQWQQRCSLCNSSFVPIHAPCLDFLPGTQAKGQGIAEAIALRFAAPWPPLAQVQAQRRWHAICSALPSLQPQTASSLDN